MMKNAGIESGVLCRQFMGAHAVAMIGKKEDGCFQMRLDADSVL